MRKRKSHPLTPASPPRADPARPCPWPCPALTPLLLRLQLTSASSPSLRFLTGTRPGFRDLLQGFLPPSLPGRVGNGAGKPRPLQQLLLLRPPQGAGGSGAGAHHSPPPLDSAQAGKREESPAGTFSGGGERVKGSPEPAGSCLFPPGRAVNRRKPQWAGAGPGVIFTAALFPSRGPRAPTGTIPAPSIPTSSPGGCERGTGAEGEGSAAPRAGLPDPPEGPEGAPRAPQGAPSPCTPRAASWDGELGHSPAQADHRH